MLYIFRLFSHWTTVELNRSFCKIVRSVKSYSFSKICLKKPFVSKKLSAVFLLKKEDFSISLNVPFPSSIFLFIWTTSFFTKIFIHSQKFRSYQKTMPISTARYFKLLITALWKIVKSLENKFVLVKEDYCYDRKHELLIENRNKTSTDRDVLFYEDIDRWNRVENCPPPSPQKKVFCK